MIPPTSLFALGLLSASTKVSAFSTNARLLRPRSGSRLYDVQEASFGMGCFWQPAEDLLKVDGVMDTVAGYTGESARKPPSYDSVCYSRNNWVEGVRVKYDDSVISYAQLLEYFFEYQKPQLGSRQYASIIFAHDEDQKVAAQEWKAKNSIRSDGIPASATAIEPLKDFYKAEEYHQRYWAKLRPRFAAALLLLAISSGAIDTWVPSALISTVHTGASSAVIAGAVLLMAERKFQTKTTPI